MGEFVSKHDLAVGALTPSTASEVEIEIPPAHSRWTIVVVPVHAGGGVPPNPSVQVQYGIEGAYYPSNPGGTPASAQINVANVITREDVVNRVKLVVTPGAVPLPDGGILLRLYVTR